jgi:hypothetical protein
MTKDEIIEMAKQAGLWPAVTDTFKKELETFAKLVAAKEREKVEDLLKEYDMDNSAFANDFRARGAA